MRAGGISESSFLALLPEVIIESPLIKYFTNMAEATYWRAFLAEFHSEINCFVSIHVINEGMPIEQSPRGLVNAITTPFNADRTVDEGAFVEHFQWLRKSGVTRLLVGGTTGEFFSLSVDERKRLLVLALKHFDGHVMFHAGAGVLVDTLDLAIFAAGEGAHSVAAILPYYLANVSHGALVAYLCRISECIDKPFIIYNFPKHTQVQVTPGILSEVPHFGLKDSSGDLSLVSHTKNYFIGSDRELLNAYAVGAKGFISARANAAPDLYAKMDAASLKDPQSEESLALHQKVRAVCDELSGPDQIRVVKEAVRESLPGYPAAVRLPLM